MVGDVPPVAAGQGGVFTAAQARSAGWTERQVRRRRETGAWRVVAGRGLAAGPGAPDALALAWAAQLTWPHAVVSHRTAALLHGFDVPAASEAHVIVPAPWRSIRGIRTHGIRVTEDEVEERSGLRLTDPRRTAVDCLATAPPHEAFGLWVWVSSRGVLDPAGLAEAARHRLGWHGTPALLALLTRVARGAASPAELLMHDLLDRAGITGWAAGVRLPDVPFVVADLLFEEHRVVVEVDGWQAHASHEAFVSDRRRQNRLTAAGYLTLRVTHEDLTRRPADVLADLRRTLHLRKITVSRPISP